MDVVCLLSFKDVVSMKTPYWFVRMNKGTSLVAIARKLGSNLTGSLVIYKIGFSPSKTLKKLRHFTGKEAMSSSCTQMINQ